VAAAGVFQRVRVVDENGGVLSVVFLAAFDTKRSSENALRGWFKPCLEYFVCVGADSVHQHKALVQPITDASRF